MIYELKETISDLLGKTEDLKYATTAKDAKKAAKAMIRERMPSMYKVALENKKAFDRRHR